ncbi:MAG: DUF1887 family CARF protein [Gammaproteobacteria bacterium]
MYIPATHLCLVHDAVIANLTPALDPNFKPGEVILLHGPGAEAQVGAVEATLQTAGIAALRWPVRDGWDIDHLRERVLELLASREQSDIALNASGGTRAMSIAAYEIFYELGKPVFYVHPETDHVTWIHRRDLPAFDLADRIKLGAFFQAHGALLESQGERDGVSARLRKLTAELIELADTLARPLAALNWLARQAEGTLRSPALSEAQRHWPELNALIARFGAEDLCLLERGQLVFADEAARFFVNGGWLEAHTYGVIYGLRAELPKIQDLGRGLAIARGGDSGPVRNELDVAFLCDNRLYIIECKTKRYGAEQDVGMIQGADTPGADTLYKLEVLKDLLGGAPTRAMLVSYHELSRWDSQRARDLGVALCTGKDLPRLAERVRRWIGGSSNA